MENTLNNDFTKDMPMPVCLTASGVLPACLMPFDDDGEIDAVAYRGHLADLAAIRGVTGVVINGHAAEVHALSFEEQQRGTALGVEAVGDRTPIVCGIYADSTTLARKLAVAAERAGAHGLLVFPPCTLMFGGSGRPELAATFIKEIAEASSLPIIVFQFPAWTNLQYGLDALVRLAEQVPSIVAIKDLCIDPVLHERHIRTLHGLPRPVNVLTTHSMWLAGSLPMGARGIVSGAGSVIADRQVALFEAFDRGDASAMRQLTAEMFDLVQAFYGNPYVDWQARMKETLFRFGRLPAPTVRGPLQRIADAEWRRMQALFDGIGFNSGSIYRGEATREPIPA
jgi:4-hydroxy-tetrahydrodipicolinate synthase